jgi:hypothetical protein
MVSPRNTRSRGKGAACVLGIVGGILDLGHLNKRTAPCHPSEKGHSWLGMVISGIDQPFCSDQRSLFPVDWIPSHGRVFGFWNRENNQRPTLTSHATMRGRIVTARRERSGSRRASNLHCAVVQ